MFSALVVVAFASTAGASACACEQEVTNLQRRSAALEAELASLRSAALSREDVETLVREAVARELKDGARGGMLRAEHVVGDGTTHSHPPVRRLDASATPTHVSVDSRHVHEFPSGHTCGTVAGYMTYLPLKADGSVSWEPSPSDVTGQYSIGTVATDWSQTQLQALDAPLKIVHDATCTMAPTLELQLNTTVSALEVLDTLTVDGVNVGTALASSGGTPAWVDLDLACMSTRATWGARTPQLMVSNGIAYLRGAIMKDGSFSTLWGTYDHMACLPCPARLIDAYAPASACPWPAESIYFPVGLYDSIQNGGMYISTNELKYNGVSSAGSVVFLDGIFFPTTAANT